MCIAGARWAQETLTEHADDELAVYTVWFKAMPHDERKWWRSDLLTDPRVAHYWDEEQIAGHWFGENVTTRMPGHLEWDAWILFDGDAEWGADGPAPILGWGRTVMETRSRLGAELADLLGK